MNKLEKILLSASLLGIFPMGLLIPLYAIFVERIGGDILDAGISYGLFSISSGLFVFFVTRRKFFHKHLRRMVVIGYVLVLMGQAGYFFVHSPVDLFLIQIVIGIANGILDPAWDGLYSAEKSELHATTVWSTWASGQRIVIGLGAITGAFIIATYSFTILFSIMLVLNFLAVLVSLKLLRG